MADAPRVRRYKTARFVFIVLAFFSWVLVATGVLLVIVGIGRNTDTGTALPGLQSAGFGGHAIGFVGVPMILTGLLIVATHQVSIAVIDGSVAVQETSALLRDRGLTSDPSPSGLRRLEQPSLRDRVEPRLSGSAS